MESVLGAIYVSDNFSPEGVETFFDRVLKPFFDQHITLKTISHHPTKILFELFQSRGCQEFEIIKQTDPDIPGIVTCEGTALRSAPCCYLSDGTTIQFYAMISFLPVLKTQPLNLRLVKHPS